MAHGRLTYGEDYISMGMSNLGGRPLFSTVREIDIGGGRIVPIGFVTDFGSVPRLADLLFGIDTRRGSISYLTHDYNYGLGARGRLMADRELRRDQAREGVGLIERTIVYMAVRLCGGPAYFPKKIKQKNV